MVVFESLEQGAHWYTSEELGPALLGEESQGIPSSGNSVKGTRKQYFLSVTYRPVDGVEEEKAQISYRSTG